MLGKALRKGGEAAKLAETLPAQHRSIFRHWFRIAVASRSRETWRASLFALNFTATATAGTRETPKILAGMNGVLRFESRGDRILNSSGPKA